MENISKQEVKVFTDVYDPQLNCTPITEGLGREAIYALLEERIPFLKNKAPTPRVCEESGVNALLDQLIVIQESEGSSYGN